MEKVISQAQINKRIQLSISIADVSDGGAGATLYVLNGGIRPTTPQLGDFLYDLPSVDFKISFSDGWRSVRIGDIDNGFIHPCSTSKILAFTSGGLPYWMLQSDRIDTQSVECPFRTLEALFVQFRTKTNVNKVKVTVLQELAAAKKDSLSKSTCILSKYLS